MPPHRREFLRQSAAALVFGASSSLGPNADAETPMRNLRQFSVYQKARRKELFCPSCHQKRALLFAEHVDEEVLGEVPIRQHVVTIPKMLRLCFKYDRKLLGELSRSYYESIKEL